MNKQLASWQKQLLKDDNSPLSYLMQEYGAYCMGWLVRKMKANQEEAEDIFFEALLDFREQLIAGKDIHTNNIKSYLTGICRNKWLKHLNTKKQQKTKEEEVLHYFYDYRASNEEYDFLAAAEEQQERAALTAQRIKTMMAAFHQLQENCQKMLKMTIVEGKRGKEVAQLLQLKNANVVKTLKTRCMKRWLKLMEKE